MAKLLTHVCHALSRREIVMGKDAATRPEPLRCTGPALLRRLLGCCLRTRCAVSTMSRFLIIVFYSKCERHPLGIHWRRDVYRPAVCTASAVGEK